MKSKNTKETSESIKFELESILLLNKERKSAIDKISKSISKKTKIDKQ